MKEYFPGDFGMRWFFLLLMVLFTSGARAQTPPGATIDNTAHATYTVGSIAGKATDSNTVIIITEVARTPSTVEFLRYLPEHAEAESIPCGITYFASGLESGPLLPLLPPKAVGTNETIDLSQPVPLMVTDIYHQGEAVFMRLTDHDQNLDSLTVETVLVVISCQERADRELLRLAESGPNTGRFVGYIQSSGESAGTMFDGSLAVAVETELLVSYVDVADPTDQSNDLALVDPVGRVFDSYTGLAIDGAEITLINAATGGPATVFGDDGVSEYPATITSGGQANDASGRLYEFSPGGYRFPFVAAGDYRLQVTPPPSYTAPSVVPTDQLQLLPGGPFSIDEAASRGEDFPLDGTTLVEIDLPIDPAESRLTLEKTTNNMFAALGDFVRYELRVQNHSEAAVAGVTAQDRLPLGFQYQSGSTRLDGAVAPDPEISPDGRTLTFSVGEMAIGTTAVVRYVLEVAAGAPLGEATNVAVVVDAGGNSSNTAQSTIQVREDLFRSKAFIVGRVMVDNCGDRPDTTNDGIAGVRIYLEDGTFTATDERGMYHFEGLEPGTHVVQLDHETLPEWHHVVACEENTRFAGRADAQFVDLMAGAMWRADFNLAYRPPPPIQGEVGLKMSSILEGFNVVYRLQLEGVAVPLRNLRLTIMLPDSVEYHPGSTTLDGDAFADPENHFGALTYRLGDVSGDWVKEMRFSSLVASEKSPGEMLTQALLTFDSPVAVGQRTPTVANSLLMESSRQRVRKPDVVLRPNYPILSAELQNADLIELDKVVTQLRDRKILRLHLSGHTDSDRIRPRSRHIFADNYQLSLARARSVADYLSAALGLTPDQIVLAGRGPDQPMATNATADGKFMNRRVELRVESEQVLHSSSLQTLKEQAGISVETTGLRPGQEWPEELVESTVPEFRPEVISFDDAFVEGQLPGREWLWPQPGYSPPIPSTKILVKHDPNLKPVLYLDGAPVSPLNFDSTKRNQAGSLGVSLWTGVDLHEGNNHMEMVLMDNDQEVTRLSRIVHYSSPPVFAEFVPEQSKLIADGRTPPVAVFRLTDKDGHVARPNVIGTFAIDPPYAAQSILEEFQVNPLSGLNRQKPIFEVGEDGLVRIELQATSRTGEAVIHFQFVDFEQELRVWLEPEPRDWILVGLAEGTVGYNAINGHMENALDAGVEDKYFADGRVAFYAKGRIKGEWLLTAAYDSAKDERIVGNSLHQTIDPDSYYALYGDATQQSYDAASARKLFVKLERRQFYALFGDYNTGMTVNELSRYSRDFNGAKAELKTGSVHVTAFASQTQHTFHKDEIRGDGTSGLYRLQYGDLVINSEKIIIETRDRFRSELILTSRSLTRHVDYAIDYDSGTLFFREPVFSQDEEFNPIFIVVDYETRESQDHYENYGGRGAVRLADEKLEVGATYLHQEAQGGVGDLVGFDGKYLFTPSTELKAEFATTDNELAGSRQAYLVGFIKRSGNLDGRLYRREQETGFGLGQQSAGQAGTRKTGLDLNFHFSSAAEIRSKGFRQVNLLSGTERDMGEARLALKGQKWGGNAGLRYAEDRLTDGEVRKSEQLTAGANYQVLNSRMILKLDHDQSLGKNNNASADFPTRTSIGADYKVSRAVTLQTRYEISNGATQNTQGARVGARVNPWSGGEINTSLDRQFTENGNRAFAQMGLRQAWQINPRWSVSGGLDFSHTETDPVHVGEVANVPPAFGSQADFVATSLGCNYRGDSWQANNRVEFHFSDQEDRWVLAPNVMVEPKAGLGLAATARIFTADAVGGLGRHHGELRLGLAHRPRNTRWIVLDRLDLSFQEQSGPLLNEKTWRIVNNLNLNYKHSEKTQVGFQYAGKYVGSNFDHALYSGYTHLVGVELRHDLTTRWDVGVRQSLLHSWNSGQFDDSTGLSIGCNVFENAWASLGYNLIGYTVSDFSAAGFTSHGLFLQFRLKFAQDILNLMGSQFATGMQPEPGKGDEKSQ